MVDFVEDLQEGLMWHPTRGLLYVSFDHVVGFLLEGGICRWQSELLVQLLDSVYLGGVCKRIELA